MTSEIVDELNDSPFPPGWCVQTPRRSGCSSSWARRTTTWNTCPTTFSPSWTSCPSGTAATRSGRRRPGQRAPPATYRIQAMLHQGSRHSCWWSTTQPLPTKSLIYKKYNLYFVISRAQCAPKIYIFFVLFNLFFLEIHGVWLMPRIHLVTCVSSFTTQTGYCSIK